MENFRYYMLCISVASGLFAGYLSLQVDTDRYHNDDGGASISIDSAKDGGAVGFGILSGLALIAASITFLKDDKIARNTNEEKTS